MQLTWEGDSELVRIPVVRAHPDLVDAPEAGEDCLIRIHDHDRAARAGRHDIPR